jgi:lipopolysaccharide exporter
MDQNLNSGSSLRSRMQIGTMWMVAFKLADRGLGFISTLILARVLVPGDFGIVAMATAVITLIKLFSAFGLDVALIRASLADQTVTISTRRGR